MNLNNPERDAEIERKRVKEKVGELYAKWKAKLTSKRRSQTEIQDAFLELRTGVNEICQQHSIPDFAEFTLKLIDEHLAEMMTMEITSENQIVEMIQGIVTPESRDACFTTEEELMDIPWIAVYEEMQHFVGWLVDGKLLVATFERGRNQVVGILKNTRGISRLPNLDVYQKELDKSAQATATPPGEQVDPAKPAQPAASADGDAAGFGEPELPGANAGHPDPSRN